MIFERKILNSSNLVVRNAHDDRSEELLEIVGHFLSASIALASRVERDEDGRIRVDGGRLRAERARGALVLDRVLDGLDLHRDGRKHAGLESVEFVEAAPGAALHDADEDPAHGVHI